MPEVDRKLRGFGGRENKVPEKDCEQPIPEHNLEEEMKTSGIKSKSKIVDPAVSLWLVYTTL